MDTKGFENFDGFILPDGTRVSFSLCVTKDIRVVPITVRNHPAYNRSGDAKQVVCVKKIKQGACLGCYGGKIESGFIAFNPYQITPDDNADYIVDASEIGNDMRFINDSRSIGNKKPNVKYYRTSRRIKGYFMAKIIALRDIEPGEEILVSYGDGYWDQLKLWYTTKHPIECNECNYRTTTKKNLDGHYRRNHDVIVMLECEHCDFTTNDQRSLDGHVNSKHSRLITYECEHCDYFSYCLNQTHVHELSHSEKNNYQCLYCDMSFTVSYKLKRHVNAVHTQAIQFECNDCPYISRYKADLKRHVLTYHSNVHIVNSLSPSATN